MALPSLLGRGGSAIGGMCSSCRAHEASSLQSGSSSDLRPAMLCRSLAYPPSRGTARESLDAIRTFNHSLTSTFHDTRAPCSTRFQKSGCVSKSLFCDGMRNPLSTPCLELQDRVSRRRLLRRAVLHRMRVSPPQVCPAETATLRASDEPEESSSEEGDGSPFANGQQEALGSVVASDGESPHDVLSIPATVRADADDVYIRRHRDREETLRSIEEEEEEEEEENIFRWGPALAEIFDLSDMDVLDPEESLGVLRSKAQRLWVFTQGVAGLVDHVGQRLGRGEVKLSVRVVGRRLTPQCVGTIAACTVAAYGIVLGTVKIVSRLLLDGDVMLSMSHFLVMWPRVVAVALAAFALSEVLRSRKRRAEPVSGRTSFVMLLTAVTWLILVPHGLINSYVDAWPLFMSALYIAFFYMGSVRRVVSCGHLADRWEDQQWQSTGGRLSLIVFVGSVALGHWLAAWEAGHALTRVPFLKMPALLLAIVAFRTHVQASRVLGRAYDRVVVPTQLVMVGPYATVRHPIYLSYILLFASYCLGLNSFLSMAFLATVSGLYYWKRIGMEEELLEGEFSDQFVEYRGRTPYRLVPKLW